MDFDKEKIEEKVEKILRKANDSRGNKKEAEMAFKLAQDLIRKYNLFVADEIETESEADILERIKEYEIMLSQVWIGALIAKPNLAYKCDIWQKFAAHDWVYLIEKRPQFSERFDCWESLDHAQWRFLLCSQPQFADRCKVWSTFTPRDWSRLLKAQPHLEKYKNYSPKSPSHLA